MLGNIALRSTNRRNDVLHTNLHIANDAQDLQAQRVRNRLQRPGCRLDMFLLVNQVKSGFMHGKDEARAFCVK